MALQSSGTISLANVNQELGRAPNSQISLNVYSSGGTAVVQVGSGTININQCSPARPNSIAPTSMDEWYSYNHNASCGGETYPCNINSGVTVSGSGSWSIFGYQASTLQFFSGKNSYFFPSASAARIAYDSGNASFNTFPVWNADGSSSPPASSLSIGQIILNLSVPSTYGKCGYLIIGTSQLAVLDASGKIVDVITY